MFSRALGKLNFLATIATLPSLAACTGQLPGSFRYIQQTQSFSTTQEVNTKMDLLFVVDNSASMDVSQEKLRKGFGGFARKYMQPTWDIRAAVITTDAYMAHSVFQNYVSTVIPKSAGYASPHIKSRLATFRNPASNPTMVNLTTGAFDQGIRYGDLVPVWGPNWARLLPGLHDGPVTALCVEVMPYFFKGDTLCATRDKEGANTGTESCLRPNAEKGESSIRECVNTVENDTVRSGQAIIETIPPASLGDNAKVAGTAEYEAWTATLIDRFMINVTTGSAGQGSERGLGSLTQFLTDNESSSETAFFRPNSLRAVIFVSDEEDQTMALPTTEEAPSGITPSADYACDQASLIALNGSRAITRTGGYCCSEASKGCTYGAVGTTCAAKTVDDLTYTISVCANPEKLRPVADIKSDVDAFFRGLDASGESGNPNYVVVSIVPLTGASIQKLQDARTASDTAVGGVKTWAVDRGDRYLELGTQVGNGSLSLDIGEEDYAPALEAIGDSMIRKKGTFALDREPTGSEDMIVSIVHSDGTQTIIAPEQYVIEGKSITVSDVNLILSFKSTDQISINYQPRTAF